jgi:hypothetical protein
MDRGFRFVGARRPRGGRMSMLEAVWEGDDFWWGGEGVGWMWKGDGECENVSSC